MIVSVDFGLSYEIMLGHFSKKLARKMLSNMLSKRYKRGIQN